MIGDWDRVFVFEYVGGVEDCEICFDDVCGCWLGIVWGKNVIRLVIIMLCIEEKL